MKVFYGALTAGLLAASAALGQAPAPPPLPTSPDARTYVVTYLEIIPSGKAPAIGLLKQLAVSSRKEAGNERYDVLQRIDRDYQFVILEAWATLKDQQAHDDSDAMKQFKDKLAPLRSGPYDERPSVGVAVAPASGTISRGAVYAVTHVDAEPNFKEDTAEMLKKLANDARKEPGDERFEAWQEINRPNHFTVTEIWKNQSAETAHIANASTKEFREKLAPMAGALYDERLYKRID
jgi:quinol monooxygenase YgiN